MTEEDSGERPHRWKTSPSEDRTALEELEEKRVAPLGKQGKCPVCFLELPMTRICGYCGDFS